MEKYLRDHEYYENLYDLMTVKKCLRTVQIAKESFSKELKEGNYSDLSDKDRQKEFARAVRLILFFDKAAEYEYKEKTISEWVERDRKRQNKYDSTQPDTTYCTKCNSMMEENFKTLHNFYEEPYRVLFFYECPKCKKGEAFYDDGEKYEKRISICEKCGGEIKTEIKEEGSVTKWIESCTSCDYEKIDVEDNAKKNAERKKQEKEDKFLLEKYRKEFCLSDEEGKEHLKAIEHLKQMGEWMKENEMKNNDPKYQKAKNIKQYKVIEINKIIKEAIKGKGFSNLIFEKPETGRNLIVPISLQDANIDRDEYDSRKELKKIIKKALENTNWRLMSEGISYRAGYLSGRLRCYENTEDLAKALDELQ